MKVLTISALESFGRLGAKLGWANQAKPKTSFSWTARTSREDLLEAMVIFKQPLVVLARGERPERS